jgi:hypothetical protein
MRNQGEQMSYLLIFTLFVASVTSSPAAEPVRRQFNYKTQIGVAEIGSEGNGCMTIMNPTLRKNEPIYLVSLQKPQTVIRARITAKTSKSCSKNTATPTDASFYVFRVQKNEAEDSVLAIAVSGFYGSFTVAKGKARADLNSDGRFESFRVCASNEGSTNGFYIERSSPLGAHIR